jgi:hypothetical protein
VMDRRPVQMGYPRGVERGCRSGVREAYHGCYSERSGFGMGRRG